MIDVLTEKFGEKHEGEIYLDLKLMEAVDEAVNHIKKSILGVDETKKTPLCSKCARFHTTDGYCGNFIGKG